jgi:hypothetical protein
MHLQTILLTFAAVTTVHSAPITAAGRFAIKAGTLAGSIGGFVLASQFPENNDAANASPKITLFEGAQEVTKPLKDAVALVCSFFLKNIALYEKV